MSQLLLEEMILLAQVTMPKPYISNIKSCLSVEAEISVTKIFITANMKNYKLRGKQEVDVR
jgi:hypothetical protein